MVIYTVSVNMVRQRRQRPPPVTPRLRPPAGPNQSPPRALPAWLHVGSEIRFHRLLRVGDTVEVRTVPTAKWERKGHEFVDLRIVYLVAGEVATEIVHTSIFKIADRRDQEP